MPKKLGINTKSVEAKARKEAAKQAKIEEAEKIKEDEFWKDDDKHIARKQNRRDEREKKKQETAERKAINKAVYEEEMGSLKSKSKAIENKVTRADISVFLEKPNENKSAKKELVNEQPLEENLNRVEVEGEARTVDEAISVLSVKDPEADRHPERRVKAAYNAFEEMKLPQLKEENPNLRLSQLKQLLKKEWLKSPDNPLNQRTVSYNAKITK